MASPPPLSLSTSPPPYPTTQTIPMKRPSITTPSSAKRRKASTTSSIVHPLRQSSFPPAEGSASPNSYTGARDFSPDVDRSTQVSKASAMKKRKIKREEQSVVSGSVARSSTHRHGERNTPVATSAVRAKSEVSRKSEDDAEEDDDEAMGWEKEEEAETEGMREKERLLMLSARFSTSQGERYDMWRRAKLENGRVKKLVNHTLSQSVGDGIATVMGGASKVFIGNLIERARQVQAEWLAASEKVPTGDRNPRYVERELMEEAEKERLAQEERDRVVEEGTRKGNRENTQGKENEEHRPEEQNDIETSKEENTDQQTDAVKVKTEEQPEPIEIDPPPAPISTTAFSTGDPGSNSTIVLPAPSSTTALPSAPPELPEASQPQQHQPYHSLVNESDRGPLTPDHLREALRRYKKDRQGGSAGFAGLSLGGRERVASRVGGGRLFR